MLLFSSVCFAANQTRHPLQPKNIKTCKPDTMPQLKAIKLIEATKFPKIRPEPSCCREPQKEKEIKSETHHNQSIIFLSPHQKERYTQKIKKTRKFSVGHPVIISREANKTDPTEERTRKSALNEPGSGDEEKGR